MRRDKYPWLILAMALLAGCGGGAGDDGQPVLKLGEDLCAACGMKVTDAKFAAAALTLEGASLAYDAIECLVRDLRTRRGEATPTQIWLPDLATGTLHPSAEMTVVLADFPSPMGGGYAAFSDSDRAAQEAAQRGGVAGELSAFVTGTLHRPED